MEEIEYPIPKNLMECFDVLDKIFTKGGDLDWIQSSSEDEVLGAIHFSLGRWIRNQWGLWNKETDLYFLLEDMGLWHPDDMSSFIITSYYRKKNNQELDLEGQIKLFKEFWKEYEQKNGPVEK
jgi:hypothetical protein